MPLRSDRGQAVAECLAGTVVALLALMGAIQLFLLLAGQAAVETASHFAARCFALHARLDARKARQTALAEAIRHCLRRPGADLSGAAMTSVDLREEDGDALASPRGGTLFCVRVTHGVELVVPWIDRIFYALAPLPKTRVGDRFYLLLQARRLATVE